jgi:hypothetical protein
MGEEKEGSPEDGGADGEVIVEMAGGGAKGGANVAVLVDASAAEPGVGGLIVVREIEAVLDERSAGQGVVADAVAANPGINERQGKKKENKEKAPGRVGRRRMSERVGHEKYPSGQPPRMFWEETAIHSSTAAPAPIRHPQDLFE